MNGISTCRNIVIEASLVKGYAECWPQCPLSVDMAFCLAFVLSQKYPLVMSQANWPFLRKFLERAALLLFSMCFLACIYMFF